MHNINASSRPYPAIVTISHVSQFLIFSVHGTKVIFCKAHVIYLQQAILSVLPLGIFSDESFFLNFIENENSIESELKKMHVS